MQQGAGGSVTLEDEGGGFFSSSGTVEMGADGVTGFALTRDLYDPYARCSGTLTIIGIADRTVPGRFVLDVHLDTDCYEGPDNPNDLCSGRYSGSLDSVP